LPKAFTTAAIEYPARRGHVRRPYKEEDQQRVLPLDRITQSPPIHSNA
jgi:hypothetical protein